MNLTKRHYDDLEDGVRFIKKSKKRSASQSETKDPIEACIHSVGMETVSVRTAIMTAAQFLESELVKDKEEVISSLLEVVTSLPERCSTYSTLAGVLNAKSYNFGEEFVEGLVKTFNGHMKTGNWLHAQYTLRFISDLVNSRVISSTSLLQLYDLFMEAALEDGVPQVRRDWLVFAILNCLPWVGRELHENKEKVMTRLMMTIGDFMKKRKQVHVGMLQVWSTDEHQKQEEYLECLWRQVERLKLDGWVERHIFRPYTVFDSVLCESLQHILPVISLPPHREKTVYPIPQVVFRLFDYTDCPEGTVLPGTHNIERYLIEQALKDILRKYHNQRFKCATHLLKYQHSSRIPLEYIIVEVMFGELFRLPTPEYLEICYASILIEMSQESKLLPQVIAQATELLFRRIDTMHPVCVDRFVNWFSYNLNNMQFRWNWDDWADALNLGVDHPRQKFIGEAIKKCMRLSYYEKIAKLLPKSFEPLIPPLPRPQYKFAERDDGTAELGTPQAKQIQTAFREKASVDVIIAILEGIPDSTEDGTVPIAIDVFSQTLFMLGSKSLTHAHSAIAKYEQVLKRIVKNEDAELRLLKSAHYVWKHDTQMLSAVVDMLLKYQIIHSATVAKWVFLKEMQADFTRMYLWEILHLTIRRMNAEVSKMRFELNEMRDKIYKVEFTLSESESEDEENNDKADPDEGQIGKLEELLESAQVEQKNLFLTVFKKFIMILSEYILKCNSDGEDLDTPWYRFTIGRLQQVFMDHAEDVAQYSSILEVHVFTQALDENILQVFHQFRSLRE